MKLEKKTWDAYSDVLKPFYEDNFDALHKNILAYFEYWQKTSLITPDMFDVNSINSFVGSLFFIFSQDSFDIPPDLLFEYFHFHLVLANLIRISVYRNSDTVLRNLINNPFKNLFKILTLYSAYNSIVLDRKTLLSMHESASLWFCNFISTFQTALADSEGHKQLQFHLADTEVELLAIVNIEQLFFALTFIDPNNVRYWKSKFNVLIQKGLKNSDFETLLESGKYHHHMNKIAVVAGCWFKNHSVYRNQYHFLKALSEKYELSLFSVEPLKQQNTELFKECHQIVMCNGEVPTDKIEMGNFSLIYFADVGLNAETSLLSNIRLAPIQVASYGYPVSTFGSKIDYWIGGLKGEKGTSDVDEVAIQKRYSEKFIGLPGLGITNTIPEYAIKNIPRRTDRYFINCNWCAHKLNHDLIESMKNILSRSIRKDLVFRIFSCTYGINYLTLLNIMAEYLGNHVEVLPAINYPKYMELMEEGQFTIEAYPFGGCNTVVDALWLRQPIVCLEGNHWYSNVGTSILLQAGVDQERKTMLAANVQQYEDYIVSFINDNELLEAERTKLLNADIDAIFDPAESHFFVLAIDDLMTRAPINEPKF